ncbi:MAG: MBL fold metallo-hydrolase [Acetobacteraceae bacterium]|nr:MBL fold metallo-hydrolase [Acetobacteraceae bacterium]
MPYATRRGAFGLAASLGALAAAPTARAAAPLLGTAAPAWYRFRIGEFEATVVSDGHLPLGRPAEGFPTAPAAEMGGILRDAFLPADSVVLEQNALVVNTGRQLILFDTGMGESMGAASRMFGPTTGRLLRNLQAAGFRPEQFDLVVLTHAHCDHCWGLVDAAGHRVFPNAQVAVAEADVRFWTDDANKRGPAFMEAFIEGAKRNLNAYRDRLVMVRDEQPVAPGVTAIAAPGHTVGHHVYAVTSGGMTVMNTGDLAHHHAIMLRRPAWEFAFDSDPAQSARTRTRMLDRFATERHHVLCYHFPWPGLGHVARANEGYAWVPAPMNVTSAG